ncbi:MAG: tocopherol cyclase family protein [Coriobacteriia bacterium]
MIKPHRIWNPAVYQGGRVSKRYFEGWYFKQVDAEEKRIVAVIPGVSYSADGTSSHAFVQIVSLEGMHYFAYPIEAFSFDPSAPFGIRIGANAFSQTGMKLDLKDGAHEVKGELRFGPWWPWPVTTFSPGIMGWYRFVPGMETYHGVLSMDHELSGSIMLDGEQIDFTGGHGYVEKDWGHSFPSSWIWAQSNHFDRPGTSLTLSVAKIPWMKGSFVGHIAGLLLDGQLHRFTTYTGATLMHIESGADEAHLTLADKHEELDVHIHGCKALMLKSPVLGAMEGRDAESLGGTIDVRLSTLRAGRSAVVFEGTGRLAGIEVMNEKGELNLGRSLQR